MGLFGIDLERPKINNPDGSFSTERTITIEADGKHFLIPTIVGGKQFDPQDAIKAWRVGLNQEVGIFNSAKEAETAAVERSKQIGQLRGGKSMGLLDRDLEELLARFAPSEQDRKSANSQAAIALGLSLLGTRKGQEWQSLGNAGMNAMGARQQYLSGIGPGKLAALGGAAKAMELTGQLRSQKDLADYQEFLRNQGGATALPTAQPPSGPMPQQFQAPPMPPTVSGVLNRPELPQVSQLSQGMLPPPQQPQAGGSDPYAQLMARAEQADAFARQTGNQAAAAQADKLREAALKWRDENTGVETVMGPNGPMLIQRRKHGDPTALPYQPKPDLKEVSTGASKFFIDPLSQKRYGGDIPMQMTPGEIASNQVARGHLGLAINADRRAAANVDAGKWTNDLDRGIQINSQTGETRPITSAGAPLPPKPTTEQSKELLDVRKTTMALKEVKRLYKPEFVGVEGAAGEAQDKYASQIPGFGGVANPQRIQFRQSTATVVNNYIQQITGATVGQTGEQERLMRAVPTLDDSPAMFSAKMEQMEKNLESLPGVIANNPNLKPANKSAAPPGYDALPKGATYTAPDGSQRIKR